MRAQLAGYQEGLVMLRLVALLTVPLPLALVVGCMADREYVDPSAGFASEFGGDSYGDSYGQQNLRLVGGSMQGNIGPVRNLGRNVTVSGYDDGVCTYVTIEGLGENGHGTMVIDVMPRVDDLGDGEQTGIGVSDTTYEGSYVTSSALTDSGELYDGEANDGHVVMRHLANGVREVEVFADYGDDTQSTATFLLAAD